jgi:chitosanase
VRPIYGGGPEDVYLVTDADNDLQAGGEYPVLFYDGPEPEAAQVTDLLTMDGDPVTFITTSNGDDGAAKGQIPPVQGPDEVWQLWCSVNDSPRVLLTGKVGDAVRQLRQQVAVLTARSAGALSALADVDAASVTSAPDGVGLVKRAGGVWAAAAAATNYQLTEAQTIPLPFGTPADGDERRWRALADQTNTLVTFADAFRTTTTVPQRSYLVPAGQALLARAEFSSLLAGWVLTEAVITTGVPAEGSGGALSAGGDTVLTTAATFVRTATEPEGATITGREWRLLSGPMGEAMVLSTEAAVTWKPGSSVPGSNDIRNPVFQELALRLTSTAQNGVVDWSTTYAAIEDPGDGRGYTAGIIRFASATRDMLQVVQQYAVEKPTGNPLTAFIPGLQRCADIGTGAGASDAAAANLGTAFQQAWASSAANDPKFRKVQRDFRRQTYWSPVLAAALTDGVGPAGLAIYYDIAIFHGRGSYAESFESILQYVRQRTPTPAAGGDPTTWLNAVIDRRHEINLTVGVDLSVNANVWFHRLLVNGGTLAGTVKPANQNLVAPIEWACRNTTYSLAARPDPIADSLIGVYTLRYTATGAGADDVLVTVA